MSDPRNTVGHALVKDAKWLDAVADVFGKIVGAFYRLPGTRPLKDLLHGTWPLGHPLHPAVTDVTVGAYTALILLDVPTLVAREPGLARAADVVLLLGLATSLVSALSGLTDWNDTNGEERRNGMLHGLVMVAATAGFVASLALRGGGQRETAVVVAIAAWLVMLVGAYLGGEQVFGYGTQVNRHAWTKPAAKWQRLEIRAAELEDRTPAVAKTAQGVDLMVAKVDGTIYAIANTCTHAGGPLAKGTWTGDDRCLIQCPWHGSRFSVKDGRAAAGPATFDAPAFEVRLADGMVEVRAR